MRRILAIILMLLFVYPVVAQNERRFELTSEVKALNDYHDVVNQIYHTALPQKDIKMLKSLLPVVEKGYGKIKKAELPGILQDKKGKWEDGLKKMGVCVNMYKVASVRKDSSSLLNAAEKLYVQYEAMVRIVRPAMKEADAFHQVLYMLGRYYLPKNETEKIKNSALILKTKMEEFNKAPLSSRVKGKEDRFQKAKEDLILSVNRFSEVVKTSDNKKEIDKTFEALNAKYQELEKLFD